MIPSSLELRTPFRRNRRFVRAFTLMELMVVVIIIALLAGIATPAMMKARDDRRTAAKAIEVAAYMREARARAFGRGNAVLLEFQVNGGTAQRGYFSLREDADPLTNAPRTGGCRNTNWATAPIVSEYSLNSEGLADLQATSPTGAKGYICFTPGGRVYAVQSNGATSAQIATASGMLAPINIDIVRKDGLGNNIGIVRTVILSSTGSTRVHSQ
ncbi:MAG: prepilin-type N-terminal cleavage/methylation domain-containing protein [Polyangiaceae bacterium]